MSFAKKLIAIALALCVMGVAVLGFFAMADMNSHVISSCIGSLTGANCPVSTFSLADISSHINAVQTLLQAVINPLLAILLTLSIVLSVFLVLKVVDSELPNPLRPSFAPELIQPNRLSRVQHWLSIFEKRDPDASA